MQGVSVFLALASAIFSQTASKAPGTSLRTIPSVDSCCAQAYALDDVIREIDDSQNSTRWLLLRDPRFPGGPGRLVQASELQIDSSDDVSRKAGQQRPVRAVIRWVIRAGDRLVVEQDTPRIQAWLEGVALGPAAIGSSLNVRLAIDGKVLCTVALAAGRVALKPEMEVKP
jgi:hypothetical protein